MKNNNGNTLKWRVDKVEDKVVEVDDKVYKIMTNHLPHINESIVGLKTRVTVASVVNVGAIIVAIMVSKYLL